MGIIKAAAHAVGTGLADQWLEALEPDNMGAQTVFTKGVQIRKGKGENGKGSDNMVTEGSIIHVYPDQFMLLVDGGKVVDYTAEPGYYKVSLDTQPSLMNGTLGKAVKESLGRIRFGGIAPTAQRVYYINLQEIRGLKFGTKNAINYFDSFYNAELFLRAHGTYSIKITDPLKFYAEVVPKNAERLEMEDINEQYLNEFLEALQTSINQMSADGIRISYVPSKSMELGKYMANVLDEQWKELRGMEIQSVGIASISYDETSQELINMRNKGAMMGDPSVREGYVQSTIAEGLKGAGTNSNGAMAGYMGMGFGMQNSGAFMGAASATNMQQMQMNRQMQQGQQIALITDAGTPGISDPGEELVAMCHEAGIPVTSLPGPAACITALTISGLSTRRFAFEAFLPTDKKEKQAILEELKEETRTTILYEAPHRLVRTLEELVAALGNRRVTICRELTKKHETAFLTTLEDALEYYRQEDPRGECVIVMEGRSRREMIEEKQRAWEEMSLEEHMKIYEDQGIGRKDAMKMVAKDRGISKREVYQGLLD